MFEIGKGGLIPKERYISREFLELEREKLWPHVWQLACREEELPSVGSYVEYEIADQSILVVRSAPDRIQAYFNACLHRGTKLCVASGVTAELRCPFHGWCWNLDGSNREVIDAHEFDGLDPAKLHLRECKVGRWAGFVFINMDPACEPLETYLGPIVDLVAPYRIEEMAFQSYWTTIAPCNWKTAQDAFVEGYHLSRTHPQTLPSLDDVNARYETFDNHGRYCIPVGVPSPRLSTRPSEGDILRRLVEGQLDVQLATEEQLRMVDELRAKGLPAGVRARDVLVQMGRERAAKSGLDFSGLTDDQLVESWNYWVFPNFDFNLTPGQFFGYRWRPNGNDPDSCIFDILSLQLLPKGAERPPVRHEDVDYQWHKWGSVFPQDLANLPRIQAGMHSRGFQGLRLAQNQERIIRKEHEMLDRYLGTARVTRG